MVRGVAVIGVGQTKCEASTPTKDFREITYEAAKTAYEDAGITPKDIDWLLSNEYDFYAGISIADEYTPDQMGCRLKSDALINADPVTLLMNAYMIIQTGAADIVVVESHSKVSDIRNYPEVLLFSLDPVQNRPLGGHPYYLAGMDMARYLHEVGGAREQVARVVVKNKANGLLNPYAGFGASLRVEDVLNSRPAFSPLSELDVAPLTDYAAVAVLASEEVVKTVKGQPVWMVGFGHNTDSSYPESWEWGEAPWARRAAEEAFRMAGITNPRREVNVVEVSEAFSYQEPMLLEALGLFRRGEALKLLEEGYFGLEGALPVNPSGGCLGMGYPPQVGGLQRVVELTHQLRGEAGRRQVEGAEVGVAVGSDAEIVRMGGVVVLRS